MFLKIKFDFLLVPQIKSQVTFFRYLNLRAPKRGTFMERERNTTILQTVTPRIICREAMKTSLRKMYYSFERNKLTNFSDGPRMHNNKTKVISQIKVTKTEANLHNIKVLQTGNY